MISDAAVTKATGRNWSDWFRILDKEGAKKKSHQEIAAKLHDKYGVPRWWSQMVTVTWEQARGLREVHQQSAGFTANVSRTFAVAVDDLFKAWDDARRRNKWLGEKVTVRKATAPKSIRITWSDGTSVEAGFYAKGDAKSSVAVQHSKLAARADVDARKKFWADALDRLRKTLER
jgi:hypothetical protein